MTTVPPLVTAAQSSQSDTSPVCHPLRPATGLLRCGEGIRQAVLDFNPKPLPPVADPAVPTDERRALSGQNAAVLERLRRGPATTQQIAEAIPGSLAPHSRIADVRTWLEAQGETIRRVRLAPRVYEYRICGRD